MGEFNEAGITDKSRYYDTNLNVSFMGKTGETIADSIGLNRNLIERKRTEGFDTKLLKTFLIGSCYLPESIKTMIDFIKEVNPNSNVTLVVTDINKEAFDLIKEHPVEVPKNIKLEMFQGDLTSLGLKSGSVDYVRMDYSQNFIPFKKQKELLGELHRVLSDNGIVVSLIKGQPLAKNIPERILRFFSKEKGSFVDTNYKAFGYNYSVLTEELVQDFAKKTGFSVSYIESNHQNDTIHGIQTKLAVFEKRNQQVKINETISLIPKIQVIQFVDNRGPLSSEDRFKAAVKGLIDEETPEYFPDVPDFIKAGNKGVVTNYDYRNSQLSLPQSLFDSDTYVQHLALRGPLEEIILAYEIQRILFGLPRNKIWGFGWSTNFQKRFNALDLPIGPIEKRVLRETEPKKSLPKKLSGSKIA